MKSIQILAAVALLGGVVAHADDQLGTGTDNQIEMLAPGHGGPGHGGPGHGGPGHGGPGHYPGHGGYPGHYPGHGGYPYPIPIPVPYPEPGYPYPGPGYPAGCSGERFAWQDINGYTACYMQRSEYSPQYAGCVWTAKYEVDDANCGG